MKTLISFFWGMAEATFFFIVPDVWLTRLAASGMSGVKPVFRACCFALLGALLGGLLMLAWGEKDFKTASHFLDQIPAIHKSMILKVQSQIAEDGLLALFLGPLQGTPYKIYAACAGDAKIPWAFFLLVSIPARLLRFLAVTGVALLVFQNLPTWNDSQKKWLHAGVWMLFYLGYFWKMAGTD